MHNSLKARDAYPTARRDGTGTARWYVCHTRSRAEKKVDRLLAGFGVVSYPALIEQDRQWADRRKRISRPLFPSYVFAQFRLCEIQRILRTPGVVTVLGSKGYPSSLADEEIDSVRSLVDGVNHTGILPSWADFLEPGQEVVVTKGPFRGMRGVLLETRGRTRVAVRVSALSMAPSVELNRAVLQPIGMSP